MKQHLLSGWSAVKRFGVRLHKDESGQDLIEYALLAALVALASVTGLKSLQDYIGNAFSNIGSQFQSALGS